jgi:hypothetical protein
MKENVTFLMLLIQTYYLSKAIMVVDLRAEKLSASRQLRENIVLV